MESVWELDDGRGQDGTGWGGAGGIGVGGSIAVVELAAMVGWHGAWDPPLEKRARHDYLGTITNSGFRTKACYPCLIIEDEVDMLSWLASPAGSCCARWFSHSACFGIQVF